MTEWIDVVAKLGFPVAVAGFVLFRLNGKFDRLTTALGELTKQIAVLVEQNHGRR